MSGDGKSQNELPKSCEGQENSASCVGMKLLDETVFSYLDKMGSPDNLISSDDLKAAATSTDPAVKEWVKSTFGSSRPLEILANNIDKIQYYSLDSLNPWGPKGASKQDIAQLVERSHEMSEEIDFARSIFPTIKSKYTAIAGFSLELTESQLRRASESSQFSDHDRAVFKYALSHKRELMDSKSEMGKFGSHYAFKMVDFLGDAPSYGKLSWHLKGLDQKYSVVRELNGK